MGLLLPLVLMAVGAPPRSGGEPLLVDMVVAQVDATVITLSELTAEAQLALLRARGPELALTGALTPDLLRAVLRSMVTRELLLGEVRRLRLRDVAESEVDAAAKNVRDRFPSAVAYARFLERAGFGKLAAAETSGRPGVPVGLTAVLRSELHVDRFMTLRIRPSVTLRGADVERCYDLNRSLFAGEPLARVRPLIEDAIRRQGQDAALRGLVVELERKANLRFAPGFGLEGAPGGDTLLTPEMGTVGLRCPMEAKAP